MPKATWLDDVMFDTENSTYGVKLGDSIENFRICYNFNNVTNWYSS